ncbi:GNAT family N-acetyltransferase [Bradyrhizobium sp. USDA 336]|uniref:GNAT family N-acetyltransferase n=1 Tax=Bradyrhizobium sp. USDA 336 TaxID=3156311 RepID=UPI00384B6F39
MPELSSMPRPEVTADSGKPVLGAIAITRLRESDYRAVVELFRHLGPKYSCDLNDPRTKSTFDLYLADERKHGLVARLGDRIVGVILYEITPVLSIGFSHGRNDGLAVDPEFRGLGIAKLLLRSVLSHCREVGATTYMVKASNPKVISLYRSMPDLVERGIYFYTI